MFSSSRTSNCRTTPSESTKPQVAAPNFVLSLLAVCSSYVPTPGTEGEATLSEQISGLLQDKPLDIAELTLIYSYRFGFSIDNALKFIGFDGKLEDFAIKQKCFSIHDGLVSLTPLDVAVDEVLPAIDEPASPEDCAKDVNEEASPSTVCPDDESDVDVPAWQGVGSRLVKVLGSQKRPCCETSSIASESTDEGESDAESDIDVPGWQSLGSRLIATLGEVDDCWEADIAGDAWKTTGSHIARALHDDHDEESLDAAGWHNVSSRIATACKACSDDECLEDPSPDVLEWRSVGIRVIKCLEEHDQSIGDF